MTLRIQPFGIDKHAKNMAYLVPAAESASGDPEVCVVASYGPGVPEQVWNRRWLTLALIPPTAVPEGVVKIFRTHDADILKLAATYAGTRWDGHKTVGSWDQHEDDDVGLDEVIYDDLVDSLKEAPTYWDAYDYYAPAVADLRACIRSFEGTLDEFVGQEVAEAEAADAYLREDDVRDYIRHTLTKWLSDHPVSEDDAEADTAMRARAVAWTTEG